MKVKDICRIFHLEQRIYLINGRRTYEVQQEGDEDDFQYSLPERGVDGNRHDGRDGEGIQIQASLKKNDNNAQYLYLASC